MRTVGVDLGSEAARTAVAVLDWDPAPRVVDLRLGVDDAVLVALCAGADKVGIDCPLGWPDRFVDLVLAHREGRLDDVPDTGLPWRRTLLRRVTDEHVGRTTGVWPLSVSADRIGSVAMRAAVVLARLGVQDRSGAGPVAEVYPAAALKGWGLVHRGYKRGADGLDALVSAFLDGLGLDAGRFDPLCRGSDDAFDAVVCAVVARAVALGRTTGPPEDLLPAAAREGWIHLPAVPLGDLPSGHA